MKQTDKLFKLAERFARKVSLAQQTSQPSEIQNILQGAGLWDKSNEIAPMLNSVQLPDSASLATVIRVDNQLNCSFIVTATVPMPPAPDPEEKDPAVLAQYKKDLAAAQAQQKAATAAATKLAGMLKAKYGAAMKAALAKGGISVAGTMDVKWVTF